MATYDKVDPISGSFRAKLAAALTLEDGRIGPVGVSLNASGRAVVGTAGQTGLVGVLVKNVARGPVGQWATSMLGAANPYAPIGAQAGDVVDIMTNGDITGLDPDDFPAGTRFYTTPAGEIVSAATAGNFPIGWTVEAGHLIVRVSAGTAAVA